LRISYSLGDLASVELRYLSKLHGEFLMKKLLIGMASLLAIGSSALAADMAVKARPAPVAVAMWDWSGFYVGAEVGGTWDRDRWTATSLADAPVGLARSAIDITSPRSYDTSAVRAGGYVGYNWMVGPTWLVGLEGDAAWKDNSRTIGGFPGCTVTGCTPALAFTPNGLVAGGDATRVRSNWDASIRGRIGVLASPDLLLYGTGGVAFEDKQATGLCAPFANSFLCNGPPQPVPGFVAQTKTLVGWTLGAGAEWHVAGNWLVRGEYRYADFGTSSYVFPFGTTVTNNTYRFNLRSQEHIAIFGIGYKFGGPVVARY
jgi:outer membrane immunogenic protein